MIRLFSLFSFFSFCFFTLTPRVVHANPAQPEPKITWKGWLHPEVLPFDLSREEEEDYRPLINQFAYKHQLQSLRGSRDGKQIAFRNRQRVFLFDVAGDGTLQESNPRILIGHTNDVNSFVFSPNGRYLVTGSDDHTARIWDTQSGALLKVLEGHIDEVSFVAFSLDGKRIVTMSSDHTARIWDTNSGKTLRTLQGIEHDATMARFSPAQFSPDGRFVATTSHDNTVRIWDVATGSFQALEGHKNFIPSVQFSPDGRFVITASHDGTARIWDLRGKLVKTLEHITEVWYAAFSPDGKYVVTTGQNRDAYLWNVAKGELLDTLEGHVGAQVAFAEFSEDGKEIISTGIDQRICIWNIWREKGNIERILRVYYPGWMDNTWLSPDGQYAVMKAGSHVYQWNVGTKRFISLFKSAVNVDENVFFSSDGVHFVTTNNDRVNVWNTASGQPAKHLSAVAPEPSLALSMTKANLFTTKAAKSMLPKGIDPERVRYVELSPNGTYAAIITWERQMHIVNLKDKKYTTLKGKEDWFWSAGFSPDGTHAFTVSDDETLRTWDVKSGKIIKTVSGRTDPLRVTGLSPNASYFVSKGILQPTLWNMTTEQQVTLPFEVSDIRIMKNEILVVDNSGMLWSISL